MHRKIIHLDLDAFYCAVEEKLNPALRDKPFAVGGRPEERGVVSSCSYAARQYGVHSAMPMARALRLCPELIVVSPNHKTYGDLSRQVMEHLREVTSLVEQISIDEAFLDVSDIPQPVEEIARHIQETIREELGLPCSLGVATNKLVAKIATDVGKAARRTGGPPNAITFVPPGEEAEFLAPLPAEALWGIGPKTATRLEQLGIITIGDLARWPADDLVRRFGKIGYDLVIRARGLDDRPIITSHAAKSISQEITFSRDISDGNTLQETLHSLSERVSRRLHHAHLAGRTVKIKLRWPNFITLTRQVTLPQPTDQEEVIYSAAIELFEKIWNRGKSVRLLGVGISNLDAPNRQLSLWDVTTEKEGKLEEAIATLRQRFGENVLKLGRDLDE